MLKACSRCGKVHPYGMCSVPKTYKVEVTKADKIRWSNKWKKKRAEILERDMHLCRLCLALDHRLISSGLQVHHIVPILTDDKLAYNNDNLITLCTMHHKQAEEGDFSADTLKKIISSPIKI